MRKFIFGVTVGALGAYAAVKLMDQETRDNLYKKVNDVADKTKEELEHGYMTGKGKALRAGVVVRKEFRKGKEIVNNTAGNVAGKLSNELSEFESRVRTTEK